MRRLLTLGLVGFWLIMSGAVGGEELSSLDHVELIELPEIRRYFSDMVVRSLGDLEIGAFIVRDDENVISFIPWPASGEFRGARWEGAIPDDVIGIAHTHPNRWFRASRHDLEQARSTGLPIFILTRQGISVADPSTPRDIILARSGWMRKGLEEERGE